MLYSLDLFGTFVFAVTGSLATGRRSLDLFGVVVLGIVTAIGGGTLRDLILRAPEVFWVSDTTYLWVAAGGAVATFLLVRRYRLPTKALLVADAVGLAVFTMIGFRRALELDAPLAVAVVMGVMTGVAGGVIRDVLAGRVPLILRKEIYATAALAGAVLLVLLDLVLPYTHVNDAVVMIAVLLIRLSAVRWQIALPVYQTRD